MRILQLIAGLGQGGAEQVVFDLATRLGSPYRSTVCSILPPVGDQGIYTDRLKQAGVEVCSLDVRSWWQFARAEDKLKAVLEAVRPDILHAHMYHANILGRRVGVRAGIKHVIATEHITEARRRPWRFWLTRKTDPLGSITVCVSEAVRDFQMRKTGLPPERFVVIPNGIDTGLFAEPKRPQNAVRAELGIRPVDKVIGAVGRLDPQKGFHFLLPAFMELARERRDLHLVIVGDGPEMVNLSSLAAKLGGAGRIHLVGRRSDVPDFLHAFDLFVMPSVYEGFGLVLVEAMAAGVPVVTSDIEVLGEVLGANEPGGPCGRIAPRGDVPALAQAMREALDRPDPEQLDRARHRALDKFSINVMVGRYAKLYDSLAG